MTKDNLSGQTTAYTYDSNSRLHQGRAGRRRHERHLGVNVRQGWQSAHREADRDRTSSQTLTYNAVGQITTDGYSYDKVGNLTKAPGETFTYNGAQQLTSSTKDGVTTRTSTRVQT